MSLKRTDKDKGNPAASAAEAKPAGNAPAVQNKPEGGPAGKKQFPEESEPEEDEGGKEDGRAVSQDDEGSGAEKRTDRETKPAVQVPAPDPEEAAENPETARLKAELLEARSKLAAYDAGVAPEMIADAVTLATAEARAAGEVTDEAVAKAMASVLKRHPEWKAEDAGKKKAGGFKLGADPDRFGGKKDRDTDSGKKKPWNKFNR